MAFTIWWCSWKACTGRKGSAKFLFAVEPQEVVQLAAEQVKQADNAIQLDEQVMEIQVAFFLVIEPAIGRFNLLLVLGQQFP